MIPFFPERLKELREDKKITQSELAKDIKINQANISRWEKGNQDPSVDGLLKLANYFNVTVDYLLGREDKI